MKGEIGWPYIRFRMGLFLCDEVCNFNSNRKNQSYLSVKGLFFYF